MKKRTKQTVQKKTVTTEPNGKTTVTTTVISTTKTGAEFEDDIEEDALWALFDGEEKKVEEELQGVLGTASDVSMKKQTRQRVPLKTLTNEKESTQKSTSKKSKKGTQSKATRATGKSRPVSSRRKTPDRKEKTKRPQKKLKSAKTEIGLSKPTRSTNQRRKKPSPVQTKAMLKAKTSPRLSSPEPIKKTKQRLPSTKFQTQHPHDPPSMLSSGMFDLDDCRNLPYCEDVLHDNIVVDHLKMKKIMATQYAKSTEKCIEMLQGRVQEVEAKIANHDSDMEKHGKTLVTLETEYTSKRHLVEEYERAMEEFEGCKETLSHLDERAYAFLKSMRKPPVVFHHIIAGVKLMLGESDTDWDDCRRFLLDADSRRQILDFDPQHMDTKNVLAFSEWMDQLPESFTMKRAKRVSPIAALLLKWLLSLRNISEQVSKFQQMQGEQQGFIEEIETLKLNIRRMKKILSDGDVILQNWKDLLAKLQSNQEQMNGILDSAREEAAWYEAEINCILLSNASLI